LHEDLLEKVIENIKCDSELHIVAKIQQAEIDGMLYIYPELNDGIFDITKQFYLNKSHIIANLIPNEGFHNLDQLFLNELLPEQKYLQIGGIIKYCVIHFIVDYNDYFNFRKTIYSETVVFKNKPYLFNS
jgi:hypothetical protein